MGTRIQSILAQRSAQTPQATDEFFEQSTTPEPFSIPEPKPAQTRIGGIIAEEQAFATEFSSPKTTGLSNFFESSVSSAFELFGFEPNRRVEAFRARNFGAGLTSQIVGPAGVFGAAYKVSRLPKMAAALDASMLRLGFTPQVAAGRPVLAGAARETLRYAPLELGRLGVGALVVDEGDYGNLLADVGLSVAFTGALGGIGGFFRAGGRAEPKAGRIADSDVGLLPTFEYRLGVSGKEAVGSDIGKADLMYRLGKEVLEGLPTRTKARGDKLNYVREIDGGTPESVGLLNQLFNPQRSTLSAKQLDQRPVDVRLFAEDVAGNTRTLDEGQQADLVKKAGFANLDEFLSTFVYPRVATVKTDRQAGQIGRLLQGRTEGLKKVADDGWIAREKDGLFVVVKRLERTAPLDPTRRPFARFRSLPEDVRKLQGQAAADYAAEVKASGAGPMAAKLEGALERYGRKSHGGGVSAGDRYMIAKTDKPGLLFKNVDNIFKGNLAQWAKLREPFRDIASDDPFQQIMASVNAAINPQDWQALSKLNRRQWTKEIAGRLGKETDLAGQKAVQDTADWLWDVFKPSLYKSQSNPLYGRLAALMQGNMDYADRTLRALVNGRVRFTGNPLAAPVGKFTSEGGVGGFRPIKELFAQLDPDELQTVVRAAQTQTPADDLARLAKDGVISPRAQAVVKELQDINKHVMESHVMPALKGAGLDERVSLLEGYILPRIFKGDFMVEVKDAKGVTQWLSAGVTGKSAQLEADTIVKEALDQGKQWKAGPVQSFAGDKTPDDLIEISGRVNQAMGASADAQKIINQAIKQIDSGRAGRIMETIRNPNAPGRLRKQRTGLPGTPDKELYSLDDVVKASENHYRQLLRFAAWQSWHNRWMPLAQQQLGKNDVMFQDLLRRGNQFLGLEGNITKTLNNVLRPVFGNQLGGKAATRIAQTTNELLYYWQLGIVNPTFAILNLLTPLQTVAPWVSYVTKAPSDDVARMMQFMPRYGADGKPRGGFGMLHPMKVLGQSMKDMANPTPELKSMLEEAVTDGTLAPQLVDEWIGRSSQAFQTMNGAYKQEGGWGFIRETLTFMATKSENYSRMTAFTAAYRVGKDVYGLGGDQLYRFARRGTQVTQYGYGVTDRARAMTGPIGSTFGLFKNWQWHFLGSMGQYAGVAMKDGVFAPLAWQTGTALAIGGLGATPLKTMADGLANWMTDSPTSFHWLQENWGDVGDTVYFGLPSLMGISLQSSASIPGTDVRNEISQLSSFVFMERAKAAGAAMGNAWNYAEVNGRNPLEDQNIVDGMVGAFAPRAVFRGFAAAEGDYIKSMRTGLPSVQDVSGVNRFMYGLGFNPIEIERHQVAGRELYKSQEATRKAVQNLGQAYSDAIGNQDWDRAKQTLDRAMLMGVEVDSVVKSGMSRQDRERGTNMDRYDQAQVQRYLNAVDR